MTQGTLFDGVSSAPRRRRARLTAEARRKAKAQDRRQRYWKDPEKWRAEGRKYARLNDEKRRAYMRTYNKDPRNRAKRTQYARKHREKYREKYEDLRLQRNYGLTLDDYNAKLIEQGGGCGICGKPNGRTRAGAGRLHVDHDHRTEKPRGLLCDTCNRGIGQLGDDLERVRAAVRYLERYREGPVLDTVLQVVARRTLGCDVEVPTDMLINAERIRLSLTGATVN